MAEVYTIWSGANPTTAKFVPIATGTNIKTLLQAKLGLSVNRGKVIEWGISFDGVSGVPIVCELLTTGTVAATVTAHAAAGINNDDPLGLTPTSGNPFTFSTTTTGYNASAEGAITSTRILDAQLIAPSSQFKWAWPLGREKFFLPSNYLRIRVHAPVTVNAICYVVIEV